MMRSIVTLEAQDLLQIAHCGAVFMFFVHLLTTLSADITIITIVTGLRLKFNPSSFWCNSNLDCRTIYSIKEHDSRIQST